VIGPLTDPAAHGGDPADAFDLVIPAPGVVAAVVAGVATALGVATIRAPYRAAWVR
jgi:hypothetical protein